MKNNHHSSSLLLGNYGNQPFKLYTINQHTYYNLRDINQVFLNGKLNTKATLIKQLFNSNRNDFLLSEKDDIMVMTSTLLQIARWFNMYYLAELCKLSVSQIIGHVAEPLLNIIGCDHWQSATHFVSVVERDMPFESLNGSEWIFTPLVEKEEPKISRSPRLLMARQQTNKWSKNVLYQWLSSDIPDMAYATRVKRQQQAIIETRQRQAAFIIPTTTMVTNNKRQKRNNYQHIAGIIDDDTFPPSPPSILTKKRKHHHHQQQHLHYQEYNLNLLAEQATQMRGLPISPEISPSPPPFYQQQRLPSIKVMLSELNK